ncbi:MAG TPA: TolC family protein [Candidatus Eisenbacteria bacterium]|jgi:outer membrane protein|nr:TolC family protein [Candidatus Eisenbacteria bacterium]
MSYKRTSSKLSWLGFLLCLGAPVPAQTPAFPTPPATNPTSLSRKQAEALALRNNPQITVGKLRALEAAQYVREQRSALLPGAYVSLTGVDASDHARIAAGALNNPIIYPRVATGGTVSQLITDFGRTRSLVSSAKSSARAEDENSAATTAQILMAADQAFYNALETRALLQVAQQTVDARQLIADQVSALTQAKLKSDLDLSFANVDLARAKLLRLEARNNAEASLAALSAILGYPDQQKFDLVESSHEPEQPEPDVTPLIMAAMQRRPEILALQDQLEAAEKFGQAEHDLWKPTVSALGAAGVAPVRNENLPNWYGAVGVNVNIPVFNGFLYSARAKTADLQTDVAKQKLMDQRNNVARDVRISWQDSQRAFDRLGVTRELREQANLGLKLAQSRYNLGLGSIVELGQAELQKTEADIADTDAQYQYRLSRLILAYTMGEPK